MDQDEKMGEIEKSSKTKKVIKTSTGLIAIFAAVVLFFGGALTYWTYNDPNSYSTSTDATVVSKTNTNTNSSETADWKAYTNDTYSFDFKYPKDWKMEIGKPYSSTNIVDKKDFSANITDADNTHSYFYIESKAYTGTAEQYLAELKKVDTANQNKGGPTHNFGSGVKTTIESTEWLKLADTMSLAATHDWYITSNNNTIFVIEILKVPGEGAATDITAFTKKAELILGSFKFTNTTANWKAYTNSVHSYTVKVSNNDTYTELTTGDPTNEKKGYIVDFNIEGVPIRINATDNTRSDKTLEALLETRDNVSMPFFVDDSKVYSEIKVNNQRAFQYVTAMSDFKTNGLNTLLLGDKYYYQIEVHAGTMGNARNLSETEESTYNKFISNFQITK